MNSFTIHDIQALFKQSSEVEFIIDEILTISGVATTEDAKTTDLTWVKTTEVEKLRSSLRATSSNLVVIANNVLSKEELKSFKKSFVLTNSPKRTFSLIVNKLYIEIPKWGSIYPSAVIHPEAQLNRDKVIIGANCTLGKVTIGDRTILHNNVVLEDHVKIGSDHEIGSGTIIGGRGFGYSKEEDGQNVRFPHVGGILPEANIEIGSNASIDRGALGDTIIRSGVKIDNLVDIAHNAEIGENSFIIANAMIAPSANVLNGVALTDDILIGVMSFVNKSLEKKGTYLGVPAVPIEV